MNNTSRAGREWDGEAWVEAAESAIRTRDLRIEALEDCLRKASDALRKSSERIDELNAELARVTR